MQLENKFSNSFEEWDMIKKKPAKRTRSILNCCLCCFAVQAITKADFCEIFSANKAETGKFSIYKS